MLMGEINNKNNNIINNNNINNSGEECDESGLELGLTLGGGGVGKKRSIINNNNNMNKNKIGFNGISVVKNQNSYYSLSSSSSSSSYLTKPPPPTPSNQVVGWPPIRAYRMNSMVSQAKYPISDEFQPTVGKCKIQNDDIDMNSCEGDKNYNVKVEGQIRKSNFVKVNKDGNGIGRKVDLSSHSCYETLALTIEDMFSGVCSTRRSSVKKHDMMVETKASLKLLNGSSEFVLTYEDKDRDWMLVGDVPWGMFINSVKRLRIMRTAEANGLISSSSVQMQ